MSIGTSIGMGSLVATARELVDAGRGILAADESISTMSKRLEEAGVAPTETNRRDYRELLVTTPDLHGGVSGIILCDETLRQLLADGRPFPQTILDHGMLPGIKVDTGATPLAGAPGETVTEGLDGLDARLAEYVELGARFAKWRAVITLGEGTPTRWAQAANAHGLARYARSCQDAGLVPVVEPEVLMDGNHSPSQCATATATTLDTVTRSLSDAGVDPAGMVLKPNMVLPGSTCREQSSPQDVARTTVDVLRAAVSDDLAGIAFLSGGQSPETATVHLAALQEIDAPWPLTFSFGRALVSPALKAWGGEPDRVADGQAALACHVDQNAGVLTGRRVPAHGCGGGTGFTPRAG